MKTVLQDREFRTQVKSPHRTAPKVNARRVHPNTLLITKNVEFIIRFPDFLKRVLVTGGTSDLKRKKGRWGFGGYTRSAEGY